MNELKKIKDVMKRSFLRLRMRLCLCLMVQPDKMLFEQAKQFSAVTQ